MRLRWFNVLVLLCLLVGLLPSSLPAAMAAPVNAPLAQDKPDIEVEPGLRVQLMAGQTAGYLIYFRETPDLSPAYTMEWIERGRFVAGALQRAAERSQAGVRAYLEKNGVAYQSFWVDNIILVESSDYNTFTGLLDFSEIAALRQRRTMHLIEPQQTAAPSAPQGVEPNIAHVQADQAWALGYDGAGIVVANIDTGVRYTHEALVGHYRGNQGGGVFDHNFNWWDPYGASPSEPSDGGAHGTHTMGTMVGDDGNGNQIGMAPGAQWMACRGCGDGVCSNEALLECAQFIVAPWNLSKNAANPDMRPNVVNNSWGICSQSYDPWYRDVVDVWQAAGIYPVFSNGNAGNCGYYSPPGLYTVGNPARYGNVTGVGSTGRDDGQYADHSNWGPTDDPDTVNPKPGWADLKPQVVAPGVNIRSAVDEGDAVYQGGWTGTSMSAPHVTGLVALMFQAGPCLIGDYATTERIIEDTATPIPYDDGKGERTPNYATGWGEINALAAMQAAVAYCGDSTIAGQVTDAATLTPVSGAVVTTVSGGAPRKAFTDARGNYALRVFAGAHTVRAARYGYQTAVIPDVVAASDMTVTRNIALTPASHYEISGKVTDAVTGWPLYAHIAISGDPVDPPAPQNSLWTDRLTGEYRVMLAEGVTYTLKVTAWVAGYHEMTRSVGPLTQDTPAFLALQADLFTCEAPGYTLHVAELFSDSFESAVDGTFPAGGWDQTHLGDNQSGSWIADTIGSWVDAPPHSGNLLATYTGIARLNSARLWRSLEGVDLTGAAFPRAEVWLFHGNCGWTTNGKFKFQASSDAGVTWSDIGEPVQLGPSGGWQPHYFNLGAYAGNPDVRLGLVGISNASCPFHVDDVRVSDTVCEPPVPGGLVVGSVYDENYPTVLLRDADVANAVGDRAVTTAPPKDAAVSDAFYTLFAPAGAQTLTATLASKDYRADVVQLTVADGAVVEQDFFLPSGLLRVPPRGVAATVGFGQKGMTQFTLSNMGRESADFRLFETLAYSAPRVAVNGHGEWLQRSTDGVPMQTIGGETVLAHPSAYHWRPDVPDSANVLIYADDFFELAPDTLLDYALQSLGVAYTAYYDGNFEGFARALAHDGPWDLVIFRDAYFDPHGVSFPEMLAYVRAGGVLVVDTGTIFRDFSDPLYAEMGVRYVSTLDMKTVYWWQPSHRLFAVPEEAPGHDVHCMPQWWPCTHLLDPVDGVSTAMVGYTASGSVAGQAALILRNDGRTLYKGFPDYSSTHDEDADSDGRLDDIELWRNIIYGSLNGWEEAAPWLAARPATGSAPAITDRYVTLDFDASVVDQPGEYRTTLLVRNDTPYGELHVPVTMTLTPPNSWGKVSGVVTGLGVCNADPAPLSRAAVRVESATTGKVWTLETDHNGVYTLWLDPAQSPLTITVSAPRGRSVHDYYGQVGGVTVAAQQTTTRNFDLHLLRPCLLFDPAGAAMTLEIGAAATMPFTLTNAGAAAATYEFVELRGAIAPVTRLHIPPIQRPSSDSDGPFSIGVAPLPASVSSPAQPAESMASLLMPGTIAYSSDPDMLQLVSVDVAAPQALTAIGPFTRTAWAGDFGPDGALYVIENTPGDDADLLWSIDTVNGAETPVGPILPEPSFEWTGMALDSTSGTMYAAATNGYSSTLYLLDLNIPAVTLVGEMTHAQIAIALGVDNTGRLYTYDIVSDMLVQVDQSTAAGVVVGYIGFNAAYAQGMDFDEVSGQMLMSAINMTTNQSEMRVVDLDTGATALIAPIGEKSLSQLGWLALPNHKEIPWLTAAPVSGTIAADGGNSVVALDFDAGVSGMQPGTHYGALRVESNAQNETPNIPLTLTVPTPDDWGKVAGVVTALGVCDADPAPLARAVVRAESAVSGAVWTQETDRNGAYQFWLDPALNPFTLTVSFPQAAPALSYFGEMGGVTVTQRQTTTRAIDVRLQKPCLAFDLSEVSVTPGLGASVVASLTLRNTGAGVADYELVEFYRGSRLANPLDFSRRERLLSNNGEDLFAEPVTLPGGAALSPRAPSAMASRAGALAYTSSSTEFISIDLTNPALVNTVAPFTHLITAGDFWLDGILYAIDQNNQWMTIDTVSGKRKVIATINGDIADGWVGMAADPVNGLMYAVGVTYSLELPGYLANLYTIDLATATSTFVGTIHHGLDLRALAIDATGQMYAYVVRNSMLLKVDKATGVSAPVGASGLGDRVWAMDFDETSQQMLSVVPTRDLSQSWLYTVNLATGAMTPIGPIGDSDHPSPLHWLAIPNSPGISWLAGTPAKGALAADSSVVVRLVFDAGAPDIQPATMYYGTLTVESNAANHFAGIPITMTVGYPASWGKLAGVVTGPGINETTRPLGGAQVFVQGGMGMTWTTMTNAQGAYQVWFDEKYSPVSVTISGGACYGARTVGGVAVTAGNVTPLTTSLDQLSACTFTLMPVVSRKNP